MKNYYSVLTITEMTVNRVTVDIPTNEYNFDDTFEPDLPLLYVAAPIYQALPLLITCHVRFSLILYML